MVIVSFHHFWLILLLISFIISFHSYLFYIMLKYSMCFIVYSTFWCILISGRQLLFLDLFIGFFSSFYFICSFINDFKLFLLFLIINLSCFVYFYSKLFIFSFSLFKLQVSFSYMFILFLINIILFFILPSEGDVVAVCVSVVHIILW